MDGSFAAQYPYQVRRFRYEDLQESCGTPVASGPVVGYFVGCRGSWWAEHAAATQYESYGDFRPGGEFMGP